MLLLMTVASQVSCKWVYKMLGPGFTQTCLYFYWHWVQKLIVKPLDTSWAKKLDMPDGKVLILCKTCTKVNAVLVPIPPWYLEQHHKPVLQKIIITNTLYDLILRWNLCGDLKANFSIGFILFLCNTTFRFIPQWKIICCCLCLDCHKRSFICSFVVDL